MARCRGSRKALYNRLQRYEKPGAAVAIDALCRPGGQDPASTPAQLALAFVNTRPFLTATIIGAPSPWPSSRPRSISIDVVLPPELEAEIDAIHQLHMNPAP